MKQLPGLLWVVAALSLVAGLVVRVFRTGPGGFTPVLSDPEFYWRLGIGLLLMAIVIVLIHIRDR